MATRQIRAAEPRQAEALRDAIKRLRQANRLLRFADCPAALSKVRSALKSAEGAERHMRHRLYRALPDIEPACGHGGCDHIAGRAER